MVAHYQLQHKDALAEIQLWVGVGVVRVPLHVFAGWNQGNGAEVKGIVKDKGFFLSSGSWVITWEQDKKY